MHVPTHRPHISHQYKGVSYWLVLYKTAVSKKWEFNNQINEAHYANRMCMCQYSVVIYIYIYIYI